MFTLPFFPSSSLSHVDDLFRTISALRINIPYLASSKARQLWPVTLYFPLRAYEATVAYFAPSLPVLRTQISTFKFPPDR